MNLPFSKCYCLHLVEDKNREQSIKGELKKLGITDEVEIWWSCKRPVSNLIGNNMKSLHTDYYDNCSNYNNNLYGNVFNVSFEFYTIIKTSFLRGYTSILLMEDDIKFCSDFWDYQDIFANIPNDWDILRFGYPEYYSSEEEDKNNIINKYFIQDQNDIPGMCMIALNRKAMKYYISYMDKQFECADNPIRNLRDSQLIQYKTTYPIVSVNNFTSIIHNL